MWKDPIVEETRKLRDQYAKKLNHDFNAIYTDIQLRQNEKKERIVTLPARKPTSSSKVA